MSDQDAPYGILAEFDSAERLVAAAAAARGAGWRRPKAYAPFHVPGLAEAVGFEERRMEWIFLIGAVLGAAAGYWIQVHANLDFPIDVGGRPLIAPQAFALITFELLVLFAVLAAIGGMLALNRLPRLHHPLFEIERFERASVDGFFLLLPAEAGEPEPARAREFLLSRDPVTVCDVPRC